jgi:predicted ATPase
MRHKRKTIVLTGGPGAGKTAVLELVRQQFCPHVQILPEAAGIVFGGGFPRTGSLEWRRGAQRAIFFVQRELESTGEAENAAIVLCDRGTVDGAAYWPGPESFWDSVGTTLERELGRYDAVIHLRTPPIDGGYNHTNPLRLESAMAAAEIDAQLLKIWDGHPRRFVVPPSPDFLEKAVRTVEILKAEVPDCCKGKEKHHASAVGR